LTDLAAIQRERILNKGGKITGNELANLAGGGLRLVVLLALLIVGLVVTLFLPPLGILLLFLLFLAALFGR
jgi:hypothetical protein